MRKGENDSRVDLTHLIQSVQRIEGNPDCFGKADKHCDQAGCCWRSYCLHISGASAQEEIMAWMDKEVKNNKT